MKPCEYIKNKNEVKLKLFGFTLMERSFDYMTLERHQGFLGGLINYDVKLNDMYTERFKKDIKLFGHSIAESREEDNFRNYCFLGKKYKSVSLIDEFKKQYFKYFNKRHDDIYILRANSGEIYLILTYVIRALIKRNNSKRPLLAATRKYHIDMIKMICPDIPYVYIGKSRIKIAYDVYDTYEIDNFRFFFLFNEVHFKTVEKNIKEDNKEEHHYFKSILNRLNMTEDDIEISEAKVLPEAEESMLKKINRTGLNLDKFVFLAPEAQSCKLYDEDFWCLIINKFQEIGYDVYVNLVKHDIELKGAAGYKECDLSYAEAFALAKRAKKIVSLRSGLVEFMLQTGVPIDVLYTKFKHRRFFNDMDIYHVMSGFGISQIPSIDKSKIREFNMYEISQKECLEKITAANRKED